jgi:hypothetical protein
MTETTTDASPNTAPLAELEHQASLLLTDIMDNPQSVGASIEDGSYSKVETEHEIHEKIDVGSGLSSVELRVSRDREHDPKRHMPGKFVEAMTVYASIPGIAQVVLMVMNGKVGAVEYGDPFGTKNGLDGLEEAIDAVKLAVEERRSLAS